MCVSRGFEPFLVPRPTFRFLHISLYQSLQSSQGRGAACEWHLRVGSASRADDLARVCAAAASHVVLLADPRAGGGGEAAAAGAAFCMQVRAQGCGGSMRV